MADEEWRVADLLDEEQPIVADAKLAKQIVEVLGALDETNLMFEFQRPQGNVPRTP